jgi:hypothetical protein
MIPCFFVAAYVMLRPSVLVAPAANSEPLVSLLISKVTAERVDKDTNFDCDTTLDNATGRDLTVRSTYYSAFDGLEIVVTNLEGKVLAQQHYVHLQSTFKFEGRDFPVKQGKTTEKLGFTLDNLPESTRSLRVRLVGNLPGSSYKGNLSSETLKVEVKKGTGK